MAAIALGVLGLLWIVLRLYWQGLILFATAGLLSYFGFMRGSRPVEKSEDQPKRRAEEAPRRSRKRKRKK